MLSCNLATTDRIRGEDTGRAVRYKLLAVLGIAAIVLLIVISK